MGETAVFGPVFVDVKGFAFGHYQPEGKNLGDVKITHGGVCRNVAENMAKLGGAVTFATAFEANAIGEEARRRLAGAGVDLRFATLGESSMGMWLAIMNERGELAGSISRQPDFSAMEALVARQGEEIVRACKNLVLEIDMRASIAERLLSLAERYGRDVYVLVGNMSVVLAHPEYLSRAKLFILNEIEAEKLFGLEFEPRKPEAVLAQVQCAARRLGMREIVVTLGAHGAVYHDFARGEGGFVAAEEVRVVDSSGAGDAFFSGTSAARIRGYELGEAVRFGARLAALTLQSEESVCPRVKDFFESAS